MSAVSSNIPKIALVFDSHHSDLKEKAITERLSKINPEERLVFFAELRGLEHESLNQYSLELLSKDKTFSTATCCNLLVGHILTATIPTYLKTILSTIYSDPYLKKLFIEKHYSKYHPSKYGLVNESRWMPLVPECMTSEQQRAILNVEGLFKFLDRELPLQPLHEQEDFFEGHMTAATMAMTADQPENFDYQIFGPISEALAFIKIKQVNQKLDASADKSKELSSSMINQLYGDSEAVEGLVDNLNRIFRTQFQAEKIIKVVERILQTPGQDPNIIFVVRDGSMHREVLRSRLAEHFKVGQLKEISLSEDDLPDVEQKIRSFFVE